MKMSQSTDSHGRIIYLKFETNKGRTFAPVGKVGKEDADTTPDGVGMDKGKIIGFWGTEGNVYVYAPIGAHGHP